MNFGKLLAAGKSLVNGNESVQYRANKQVALPKFSVPKQPLVHSSKPPGTSAVPGGKEVAPAAPKPAASWASRLNPASVWRGAPAEPRGQAPAQVQTELSLDSVKVVHNDLSDADVEVVPMKSHPVAAPDLPPAKKAWEILGERLMKASALW